MVAARALRPELMDDPALDAAEHERALAGLVRINRVSRTAGALWSALGRLRPGGATGAGPGEAVGGAGAPVRVLDLATGSGDVAVGLWRRARRAGLAWDVAGCDVSPRALGFARRRATQAGADVAFFEHDLLRDGVPGGYDAYVCSLFLHHLPEADAVALLAGLREGRTVVVDDLARSRLGLAAAWLGTRVLTRSRVVRADGPQSVRNAFTRAEAAALAARAGLAGARVRPRWPFRWTLEWRR